MSKKFSKISVVLLGIALLVVLFSGIYVVPEGQQVVITQFGRPIGKEITRAGLHFKLPFIQDARYVDKRILSWDGFPNQIPTKDKKYVQVDTTARFLVIDPLKFIQTVQNERGAKTRLDTILDGITRDIISSHRLVEVVRNTNTILEKLAKSQSGERDRLSEVGQQDEVVGEIEAVEVGRERLSELIAERANAEIAQIGMKLIDVQLRRIAYEASVEKKVYERMVSERKRIAEKIRSIGKGEQAKIQGKTSKDLQQIEAEAYKKSQLIRGKAEGEATKIYAAAFNQDASFYEFTRSLDAYKASLQKENSHYLLSTQSPFLRYLGAGKP